MCQSCLLQHLVSRCIGAIAADGALRLALGNTIQATPPIVTRNDKRFLKKLRITWENPDVGKDA